MGEMDLILAFFALSNEFWGTFQSIMPKFSQTYLILKNKTFSMVKKIAKKRIYMTLVIDFQQT